MQETNLLRPRENLVSQNSNAFVSLTFKDEDGVVTIPVSASYTLYNYADGSVINSRSAVSIPGTGSTRTITLSPADNVINDDALKREEHRLAITFTYGAGGAKTGKDEIQIIVENLKKES